MPICKKEHFCHHGCRSTQILKVVIAVVQPWWEFLQPQSAWLGTQAKHHRSNTTDSHCRRLVQIRTNFCCTDMHTSIVAQIHNNTCLSNIFTSVVSRYIVDLYDAYQCCSTTPELQGRSWTLKPWYLTVPEFLFIFNHMFPHHLLCVFTHIYVNYAWLIALSPTSPPTSLPHVVVSEIG